MDNTPSVEILNAFRAEKRGNYAVLIAEGVDNAFDAGASVADITLATGGIYFKDNGCGITRDREQASLRLGEHGGMKTTALGRYGIGIKYQALSAGDLFSLDSVSSDGRMIAQVDWAEMLRKKTWHVPDPIWTPSNGNERGTQVWIEHLRWHTPTDHDVTKTGLQLAKMFQPALVTNRILLLNGGLIPVLRDPPLLHVIDERIAVSPVKGAHVRAGWLREQESNLRQLHVSYKHRVILPDSTFGCGEYGGTRKLFGRVALLGDWELDRFKTEIVDRDQDALEEELLRVLRPLLERCESEHMSARTFELEQLLNDRLPPALRTTRPQRKTPREVTRQSKSKRPPHPPGLHAGPEVPNGPTRAQPASRLKIEFEDGLASEYGYGRFLPGTKRSPGRVQLATDNPEIAELMQRRDQKTAVSHLYTVAFMIYVHERLQTPQPSLPFDPGVSFGLHVWNLMNLNLNPGEATKEEAAS